MRYLYWSEISKETNKIDCGVVIMYKLSLICSQKDLLYNERPICLLLVSVRCWYNYGNCLEKFQISGNFNKLSQFNGVEILISTSWSKGTSCPRTSLAPRKLTIMHSTCTQGISDLYPP